MATSSLEGRLLEFESLCRRRGLPLTVQRREIFRTLLRRNDHPTADAVYESVKDRLPGLSRTTVYRVLETLVDLGVVQRLHHAAPGVRFDPKPFRHHHLVCRMCDRVVDLESASLSRLRLPPMQRHGFRVEDYSVHIVGVCKECRRKEPG